jgi:hypothetical protein
MSPDRRPPPLIVPSQNAFMVGLCSALQYCFERTGDATISVVVKAEFAPS